jgi:membrane protein implicated in regulation of membrane protease activity
LNLDSPQTWRWLWLVAALAFAAGELAAPASFFFLPFAFGAGAAALVAFLDLSVALSWVVFLLVSCAAFVGFWKLGRRMEREDENQEGVGATRWLGQQALVIEDIPARDLGVVRLDREQWRAECITGEAVATGTYVMVVKVDGTRLVVTPTDAVNEAETRPGHNPSRGAD